MQEELKYLRELSNTSISINTYRNILSKYWYVIMHSSLDNNKGEGKVRVQDFYGEIEVITYTVTDDENSSET